jgi:DNA polymerase-3 subunit epsilon
MEASVLQIFKYILHDWHRFNYDKNKWIKQNNEHYQEIVHHLGQLNDSIDIGDQAISEVTFTVFDLETTGFFPEIGDEIISIGAMKINQKLIQFPESYYEVVSPVKMPSAKVRNLTGLDASQIRSGKPFPYAFLEFCEFSTNTAIVAHPASFDVNFFKEMTRRWGLPIYDPYTVDSFEMAKFLYPGKKKIV